MVKACPQGLSEGSCTLEATGMSLSGSEGQEELGCRSGHVTTHEESHEGFKEKNIFDAGQNGTQGKQR